MIDRNLVTLVADAGEIASGDVVIEVGPGTGTLTEELLDRAGKVIAVEIDRDLAALLRYHFADKPNFVLLEGDALASKHALNVELYRQLRSAIDEGHPVKLVANLPYNIASPLVIELLFAGVTLLAFTVQKEVAQRLKAIPGTEQYGPLTVMAQLLADVKLERTLPPQAFWPAPKVDSALVTLHRKASADHLSRALSTFVASMFAARRKMIRKALQQMKIAEIDFHLSRLAINPEHRPETLTPDMFLALFQSCHAGLKDR